MWFVYSGLVSCFIGLTTAGIFQNGRAIPNGDITFETLPFAWSDNYENLTVKWCVDRTRYVSIDWTLVWSQRNSIQHNRSVQPEDLNKRVVCYICEWRGNEFQTVRNIFDIVFFVRGENKHNRGERPIESDLFKYTISEIVKPNPLKEVTVKPLNSSTLEVSWMYPDHLQPSWFVLCFHIEIRSRWNNQSWDFYRSSEVTVEFGNVEYATLMPFSERITGLMPYSSYLIRLRSHPNIYRTNCSNIMMENQKGYWSEAVEVLESTMESVPSRSPEIPTGSFSIDPCESSNPNNDSCRDVVVFWKPIERVHANGLILEYRIRISCPNETVRESTVDAIHGLYIHYAFNLHSNGSCAISVGGCTSVGCSAPSVFHVPSAQTVVRGPINVLAETNRSSTTIRWEVPKGAKDDVDNYTIAFCRRWRSDVRGVYSSLCEDALNFQTIPGNETTLTTQNINSSHIYAISLNTPRGSSGLSLGANNRWLCVFDYNGKVSAPQSISAKEISSRSIILTWTPPKCDERFNGRVLHFEIKQRTNTSSDWEAVGSKLEADSTEYRVTSLHPETSYEFQITAVGRNNRQTSETVLVSTLPEHWDQATKILLGVIACVVVIIILCSIVITINRQRISRRIRQIKAYFRIQIMVPFRSYSNLYVGPPELNPTSTSLIYQARADAESLAEGHHYRPMSDQTLEDSPIGSYCKGVSKDSEGKLERISPDSGVGDRTEMEGGSNEIDSSINTSLNSEDRTEVQGERDEIEMKSNEIDSIQLENSWVGRNPPDSNFEPNMISGPLESEEVTEFTASSNNDEQDSEDDDYRLVKYEASEDKLAVPDLNSCAKDLQDDSTNNFLLTGLPNESVSNQSEYSRAVIANSSESNADTSGNSGEWTEIDSNINTSLNSGELHSREESEAMSSEDELYRPTEDVTTLTQIARPLLNSPAREL